MKINQFNNCLTEGDIKENDHNSMAICRKRM